MSKPKIIVADKHLTPLAHLDPLALIDPETMEDWNDGRHTLTLGYPTTGPKVERQVPLTLGDIWHFTLKELETYDPDEI